MLGISDSHHYAPLLSDIKADVDPDQKIPAAGMEDSQADEDLVSMQAKVRLAVHNGIFGRSSTERERKNLQLNDCTELCARKLMSAQQRYCTHVKHDDWLASVRFSPCGKFLATASGNSTKIFDAASGKPVLPEPIEHQDKVWSVSYSPCGKFLATGSTDKFARIFEAASGKPVLSIEHQDPVQSVCYSPCGKFLFAASGMFARIFEAASGKPALQEPIKHDGHISSICYSPCGKFLATGSWDNFARIFEADSGEPVLPEPIKHDNNVSSVCYSPCGKFLATGSYDGFARIFEAASGKPALQEPIRHASQVQLVCYSPCGKYLVTGSLGGPRSLLRIFDVFSGKPVLESINDDAQIFSMCYSPCGKFLATGTGNHDTFARIFNCGKPVPMEHMSHDNTVHSICYSPCGKFLATASGMSAKIFDAASGKPALPEPIKHDAEVLSVRYSPCGKFLATASGRFPGTEPGKFLAKIFDTASGKPALPEPIKHDGQISSICYSPCGKFLATGSWDDFARIFEAASGEPALPEPIKHDAKVVSVCYSPCGKFLATGSVGNFVRIFEAASGKPALQEPIQDHGVVMCYSPCGTFLAIASGTSAKIFEAASGKPVLTEPIEHQGFVTSVCYSPCGKFLATGSTDKFARIFEAASGKPALPGPFKHDSIVWSVCYSPCGKFLATGSRVFETASQPSIWTTRSSFGFRTETSVAHRTPDWAKVYGYNAPLHHELRIPTLCAILWRRRLALIADNEQDQFKAEATKTTGIEMMRDTLVLEFLQTFGVEELLKRDALGMSAIRHALMEDDDAGFCQEMITHPLLEWYQANPFNVFANSYGDDMHDILCAIVNKQWILSVTLTDILDACSIPLQDLMEIPGRFVGPPFKLPTSGSDKLAVTRACGTPIPTDAELQALPGGQTRVQCYIVALGGLDSLMRSFCDNEVQDEVFTHNSVQAMVEIKWKYWRFYFYGELAVYLSFLASYTFCTVVGMDERPRQFVTCVVIAGCLGALLVLRELMELFALRGLDWSSSVPLLFVPASILCISMPLIDLENDDNLLQLRSIITNIEPFVCLILWLYLLYFFDGLPWAGGYIKMMRESLYDIRGFLVILATIIIGVAHSFSIATSTALPTQLQVVYRLGLLGDFDADVMESSGPVIYIIFLSTTAFITIMMLNILIAVISDTYDRVQEVSLSAFVRGRARKIVELERAYGLVKRSRPEFLIYSVPAEANGPEDWNGRVAALKTKIESDSSSIKKHMDEKIKGANDEVKKEVEEVKKDVEEVKKEVEDVKKEVANVAAKLDEIGKACELLVQKHQ